MIRFLPVLILVACSVQAGEPQPLSEFWSVRCEGRYEFDCSLGIVPIGNGRFLVGRGTSSNVGCTGRLVLMKASAFARLLSSSYEALSSYAARTWASVDVLLSVAMN
jgi:hypothetical protein